MNYSPIRTQAMLNSVVYIGFFLTLLLRSISSQAATSMLPPQKMSNPRVNVINSFRTLAKMRPQKCIDKKKREQDIRGWREKPTQCAWGNLLQMRRWKSDKNSTPPTCLSKQALWWARAQSRINHTAAPMVWDSTWLKQILIDDSSTIKRIAIVVRKADGSWTATEWRWKPSMRTSTRKWQETRWKLLRDAVMKMRQSKLHKPASLEETVLKTSWEKNLKGSAGEISAGVWRWQRDDLCLHMRTIGISPAQLQIPYSKEDSRLEQRTAMQVQLARTYPTVTWLTRFRLLPLTDEAGRGGAKFEAIWLDNETVKAQIWIPEKTDDTILQARISVALPEKKNNETDTMTIDRIADVIERELIDLATTWTFDREQ